MNLLTYLESRNLRAAYWSAVLFGQDVLERHVATCGRHWVRGGSK